ncbi:MAG: hypothetical protein ABL931_18380, partial [Usitatibacteraceae bacterium]
QYEAGSPAPWDARGLDAHESKLGAIVGFEVIIEKVEAKLKLSQNRSAQDQENVIAKLAASESSEAHGTAAMMRENMGRK